MAWKEARTSSKQLEEYLAECAKAVESLEADNIVPIFLFLKNLFSNIISAKGGTITGQPSLEQYFDALKGATGAFSDVQSKEFKDNVIAAKDVLANNTNAQFTNEQKTVLLSTANAINEQCKSSFLRGGGGWNKGGGNGRRGGWGGRRWGGGKQNRCWDFEQGNCRRGAQCKWQHDNTCWEFRRGACRYGDNCKWKHEDPDVCWDFKKGRCKKGAECKWKHDGEPGTSNGGGAPQPMIFGSTENSI